MTAFLSGLGITAIATVAAFGVLAMLQVAGIGDGIDDIAWSGHRSAPAALLLTVSVATLAGVPPLAGFLSRVAADLECCRHALRLARGPCRRRDAADRDRGDASRRDAVRGRR